MLSRPGIGTQYCITVVEIIECQIFFTYKCKIKKEYFQLGYFK